MSAETNKDSTIKLMIGNVNGEPFYVDAGTLVTGRTCIIGASGSGKSYTVGVICEELSKNKLPFTIVDPEGEYYGIKEKYEAIWVGQDEKSDLIWGEFDIAKLASEAFNAPPIILDISEIEDPIEKVDAYLSELYKVGSNLRKPYLVILDEADRFVPQTGTKLTIINDIAKRGRKRGIGLMICTQRPSSVDKNVLSQCDSQIIGRLTVEADLKPVSQFFKSRNLEKELVNLQKGNFFIMGALSPAPNLVKIRERETKHGGYTPELKVLSTYNISDVLRKIKFQTKTGKESAKRNKVQALQPAFGPEDAKALVPKRKKFGLFGKEETIVSAELIFRPLYDVKILEPTGILNKSFIEKHVYIDAITGKQAVIEEGILFAHGIEMLLGLSETEIQLYRTIKNGSEEDADTLSKKIHLTKDSLIRTARLLEKKGLIISQRIGRKVFYKKSLKEPKFKFEIRELEFSEQDIDLKENVESLINEEEVKRILSYLLDKMTVDKIQVFFYPFYRIRLELEGKHRLVFLDGLSGKEIVF